MKNIAHAETQRRGEECLTRRTRLRAATRSRREFARRRQANVWNGGHVLNYNYTECARTPRLRALRVQVLFSLCVSAPSAYAKASADLDILLTRRSFSEGGLLESKLLGSVQ
jgi:hypothetical protein